MSKFKSDDQKGAIEDFTLALQTKKDDKLDRLIYALLGVIYDDQGQYDTSLSNFDKALNSKYNPEIAGAPTADKDLYMNEAEIYFKKHDFNNALSVTNKALAIDNNLAGAHLFRSIIEIQNKDIKAACSDVKLEKSTDSKILPVVKDIQTKFCQ